MSWPSTLLVSDMGINMKIVNIWLQAE